MEKYIITFEDGLNYLASQITENDVKAFDDGLLTIVRCSDAKSYEGDGTWTNLPIWEN